MEVEWSAGLVYRVRGKLRVRGAALVRFDPLVMLQLREMYLF